MKNCFITAMMNYLIQGLQMNLLLRHTDLDIALLPEIFRNYLDMYSALFRAGLLKVNMIFRSAPSSHFRCMSNEAFQLYFFGKLSLTFAYLSENPEFLIIWKFEKKKKKKKLKKKKKKKKLKFFFSKFFFKFFFLICCLIFSY